MLTGCLVGAIYNYGEPSEHNGQVALLLMCAAGLARFVWSGMWNRRLGELLKDGSDAAAKLRGMMRVARWSVAMMLVSIGLFAAMFALIFGLAGGWRWEIAVVALGGLAVMCVIAAIVAARFRPGSATSVIVVAHLLAWGAMQRAGGTGLMWPEEMWMFDVMILWALMLVFAWARAMAVTVQMRRYERVKR